MSLYICKEKNVLNNDSSLSGNLCGDSDGWKTVLSVIFYHWIKPFDKNFLCDNKEIFSKSGDLSEHCMISDLTSH